MENIVTLYESKDLSFGFAHELPALVYPWREEIAASMAQLARSIAGKKDCSKQALLLLEGRTTKDQLQQLASALLVARPFAKAREEAKVPAVVQ